MNFPDFFRFLTDASSGDTIQFFDETKCNIYGLNYNYPT